MRTTGKVILAIGSGLGVWVITNLADAGVMDFIIVLAIISTGALMTSEPSSKG